MAADGTWKVDSCFDAFSSREPDPTSLENAMSSGNKKGRRKAGLFVDLSAQAEINLSTSQ
jgi:hypothetical protein